MQYVAVFESIHMLLRADKLMNSHGVPHRIRPVPRHISSDCGMAIVFDSRLSQTAVSLLSQTTIAVDFHELELPHEL